MPSDTRRGPAALRDHPPGFPTALFEARLAAGLTQQELTALTGIDVMSLGSFERGREHPGPSRMKRLLDALPTLRWD